MRLFLGTGARESHLWNAEGGGRKGEKEKGDNRLQVKISVQQLQSR